MRYILLSLSPLHRWGTWDTAKVKGHAHGHTAGSGDPSPGGVVSDDLEQQKPWFQSSLGTLHCGVHMSLDPQFSVSYQGGFLFRWYSMNIRRSSFHLMECFCLPLERMRAPGERGGILRIEELEQTLIIILIIKVSWTSNPGGKAKSLNWPGGFKCFAWISYLNQEKVSFKISSSSLKIHEAFYIINL